MAFAFPVQFAMDSKKAAPIKKKRKKVEPNFPSRQQITDAETRAQRDADELSKEIIMQSGGMTLTSPEGEVVKVDCVGDLRTDPWVVSCTPGHRKHESAMQMSIADADGRVWMVDSGCSLHTIGKRYFSNEELKTLRTTQPIYVKTANGWTKVTEKATVEISALNIIVELSLIHI